MKKFVIMSILVALLGSGTTIMAQNRQDEYLGLPGDNLNLYAVMKLFQESKTLEEFEANLNDKNSNINNLDLNGDNYVDYIKVFDDVDGDVHNIVLQVAVNERENQDVAVFTVQRFGNGQVQIQLIGDEELYGKNYIIEPIFDDGNQRQTPNPGYTGSDYGRNVTVVRTTTYEIASWPVIRFIYLPGYTVWRSRWYWNYYPSYWHPWEPYYYHYYYGYHYNWYNDYYGHYRRWDTPRYSRWNDFYYTSRRSYSPSVNVRIQGGNYKNTYSRPDQRKEGEAVFAKTHPDQSRRAPVNSSDNQVRRNDTRSTPDNTGINTTRRTNTNVNNKSVTNKPGGQNSGTTRRSTNVYNKSVVNPPAGQNTGTTRRSTTVNKQISNPPAGQNSGTDRRSTSGTNRSVTNKSSERNVNTNRTPGQTKPTGLSPSNRKSSTTRKAETTVKQDEKTKATEVKKETRRK